ncbi:MAG: FMN-binding negative transcriptional regulator [Armatimonadetes bacterium]|nr:FMN-binding negative transcriptional regulator [Armatimonadota bacterium]
MPLYVPPHFRSADPALAERLMREYEFATLVCGDGPWITHLPLVLDADGRRLRGHVAKANGQASFLDGGRATAVFNGPHAYVSPTWYEESPAVPTWNYAVVHATGPTRLLDTDESFAHLDEVLRRYEGVGAETYPDGWLRDKLGGIFAFELEIEECAAKFKMSQNKSTTDHQRVVRMLKERSTTDDLAVAAWMEERGKEDGTWRT